MPAATDADRLRYLIETAELVASEIDGFTRQSFLGDRRTRDLTAYRLGTIGETAGRLSQRLQAEHPHVPWKAIYAFRHIVAHDYGAIDFERVWEIAAEDLGELVEACRALMHVLDGEP